MSTGNRAAVLRLVREQGPISRADLARLTGFTAPSISRIVEELMGRELINEESGVAETGPGRRPTLLRFRANGQHVIAATVFPDKLLVALTDLNGRVLAEQTMTIEQLTPEEAFGRLGGMVEEVRREAPDPAAVRGIGLTLPGLIDSEKTYIRYSPPTGWRDVSVARLLARHTNLQVVAENWVSARALAERSFGGAKAVADFVYVHVSAGIGASVMSGGRLRKGLSYTSAEFGHLPLTADGPLCRCGKRGCLEAYAASGALPGYAGRDGIDPESVLVAAQAGDAAAVQAVERAMEYLSLGLTGLIHLLNPSRIFLDGWPAGIGELAMAPLRAGVRRRVLEGLGEAVNLAPSELGPRGPHIGAVALVLEEVLSLHM